jgi:hypothetical protein
MNFYNKHFVAEVILEILMVMAPTYLDYLGAAGEFILKLNQQPTIAVQSGYVQSSITHFSWINCKV